MDKEKKRRSDYGKKREKRVESSKKHNCPKCSYSHSSNIAAETHYLYNHATEKERKERYKYYCDKCLYGSMSVSGWNKHLQTKKHKRMLEISGSLSSHG